MNPITKEPLKISAEDWGNFVKQGITKLKLDPCGYYITNFWVKIKLKKNLTDNDKGPLR